MSGGLLGRALSIIPPKSVSYYKFAGNTPNASGIMMPSYDEPVIIANASVQAVPNRLYPQLGLDLQKEYRKVFVPTNAVVLEGQLSSDKFEFDGRTWKSISNSARFTYDGWNVLIVVADKVRN